MNSNENNKWQTIKKIIGVLLGLFLIVLFYYRADFSWEMIINQTLESGLIILIGSTIFTVLLYYLSAYKWQLIIKDLIDNKTTFTFFHLFHYTAIGFIFSYFLPRAVSDVGIKSILLKRNYNIPYKAGVYSVLLDQFFNLILTFAFLLPAIALMANIHNIRFVLLLNLVGLGIFIILFYCFSSIVLSLLAKSYAWLIRQFQKIRFLKHKFPQEFSVLSSEFSINTNTARNVFLLTLIRLLPMVLRLYVIVLILDIDLNFYYLLLCCSVMLLFGLITIIPAQLGIGEWGWYAMLALAGLPDPQIVLFVLSSRIYSNLSILIVFLFSWCLNNFHYNKIKHNVPKMLKSNS